MVEREYRDGAYAVGGKLLGWRLLTSPIESIGQCRVAFIGLNPGGSAIDSAHSCLAPPDRSAYVAESWAGFAPGESPLQRQVRALFAAIDVMPEHALSGNLVPFRSPNWRSLPNSDRALAFGTKLWRKILMLSEPDLVVTMGRIPFAAFNEILELGPISRIQCGWGNIALHASGKGSKRLVGLPHLSRFPIVDRPHSQSALVDAFGPWWKNAPCRAR